MNSACAILHSLKMNKREFNQEEDVFVLAHLLNHRHKEERLYLSGRLFRNQEYYGIDLNGLLLLLERKKMELN